MKRKILLVIVSLIIIFSGILFSQEKKNFPEIKGAYLGLTFPGDKPELFDCRISADFEIYNIPLFEKNGNLLIFKCEDSSKNGVFIMELKNGIWSFPEKVLTLSPYEDRHFFLTSDQKKIFFTSLRPLKIDMENSEVPNIWFMENTNSGWSDPEPLDFPVNTRHGEFYSTLTNKSTLYFTRYIKDEDSNIYFSKLENGQYTKIENPGENINTEFSDADPYIAPDESYIIFLSNRPGGMGHYDFYISYKKQNGSWTKPKHLGEEISSEGNDVCPLITPDEKFFFFISNRTGNYEVYWMNAGFIEDLKPEELK